MSESIKQVEERCGVDRDSLWYTLHVALRKGCDSRPTSLVWNLGHVEGMSGAIDDYVEKVWEHLATSTKPQIANWLQVSVAESLGRGQSPSHSTLRIAFEMFDENDWEGMASFF